MGRSASTSDVVRCQCRCQQLQQLALRSGSTSGARSCARRRRRWPAQIVTPFISREVADKTAQIKQPRSLAILLIRPLPSSIASSRALGAPVTLRNYPFKPPATHQPLRNRPPCLTRRFLRPSMAMSTFSSTPAYPPSFSPGQLTDSRQPGTSTPKTAGRSSPAASARNPSSRSVVC